MGNTQQQYSQNYSEQNQEQVTEPEQETDESCTCEICIEPMLLPNKKFKNQNGCVHPFCTDCMVKYIAVKLEDNTGNIPCPALNCKQFLDPISCRNLVGSELFVKWCDVLCASAVLRLAQCYCPNPNCSELILDECGGGNLKRSKCPYCKNFFCFKCKVPWHGGFRCGESSTDMNEAAFSVLAKRKKWKRCPQCRHFVERIEGCNSIICRCGVNFCYKCGQLRCRCISSSPWFCPLMILACSIVLLLMELLLPFLLVHFTSPKH